MTRYQLTKQDGIQTIYGVLELKINEANRYRLQGYSVEQVPKNYDLVKLHRQGKPSMNLIPSMRGMPRSANYARPEVIDNMAKIQRNIIRRPADRRVKS